MSSKKQNGAIIYKGPSMLDGAPIVVIVTGLAQTSKNAKTGDMLQTWILREDVAPNIAIRTGEDASICGDCPHRGHHDGKKWTRTRTCYVQVHNAPLSVWKAYKRGNYADLTDNADATARLGERRVVRLGSYGDPMAAPRRVWEYLIAFASGWTGYTHQWETVAQEPVERDQWQKLVMASADNEAQGASAQSRGWRTFRVMASSDTHKRASEALCPASKEGGHKSTCAECKLCMGTTTKARKSVSIYVHGSGANAFSRAA